MSKCAPIRAKNGKNTCYTINELTKIVNFYNKFSKDKPFIELSDDVNILASRIQKALDYKCKNNELCWGKNVLNDSVLKKIFKPQKPKEWIKNPRKWLSTRDINNVLLQYEELYKDKGFKFLGTVPIDFSKQRRDSRCVSKIINTDQTLCSFDPTQYESFAIVFNTDRHDQSGQHWVALYCNRNKNKPNYGAYFYDSIANDPPKNVVDFMKKIKGDLGDDFELRYNTIRKQFKNSECGMFCMVFIIKCIQGQKWKDICKSMPTDDFINKQRDILYS